VSLTTYLREIRSLYGEGTPENTYVPALSNFLGRALEKCSVIPWPKGESVGLPDIGVKVNGVIEGYVEAEALEPRWTGIRRAKSRACAIQKKRPRS
jgi:hypothetical protein